jgi:hypothetical protein
LNVGQYLQGAWTGDAYTINNAGSTLVTSINRSWSDPNGNRVAECDFQNRWPTASAGRGRPTTGAPSTRPPPVNPAVLEGWGTRNRDWQMGVGISRKWRRRSAVESPTTAASGATSSRRTTARSPPADYDEVTLVAPRDERLPNGGGYPVTFLTRNNRRRSAPPDSYYTTTDDFGGETHYWHGVDMSVNARMQNGLSLQGGTSTGRGCR